jgi:hypothetical protein
VVHAKIQVAPTVWAWRMLDLEDVLSAESGRLKWGPGGFSKHARHFSFNPEDLSFTVDLILPDGSGIRTDTVWLGDAIYGENGELKAIGHNPKMTFPPVEGMPVFMCHNNRAHNSDHGRSIQSCDDVDRRSGHSTRGGPHALRL